MSLTKVIKKCVRSAGFEIRRYMPADFDTADQEVIRKVQPYTMTSLERIYALCHAVRYVVKNGIPGDMVECGVWRGGSMMAVAYTLMAMGDTTRNLYLFDTYEGMTEPSEKDINRNGRPARLKWQTRQTQNGINHWCYASLEDVKQNMSLTGYPAERIHYVKGKVEETLPHPDIETIAVLRLDTDWYESTRAEMVHLFPRLTPGGILLLDDYGNWQGARQAVDEYLEENRVKLYLSRIDSSGRVAVKLP